MTMNEADARPTNFIRQIIDEDLATGKHNSVHTRFPPEPNGYLHIGHAKSICLNFGIAQDYQGKCNLRFDDTNPVKEDVEYINSIQKDVQWLGFQWDGNVHYSSDYFDQLYQYAIELINKGLAYVDELSAEEIREYRGTLKEPGKNSPYRSRSVEENLALFEKCVRVALKRGKRAYVRKLTWHHHLLSCVILFFTGSNSLNTIKQVTNGAFIQCMILPIVFLMHWKISHILYVLWNSKITVVYMIGCWIISLFLATLVNMSSHVLILNIPSCLSAS